MHPTFDVTSGRDDSHLVLDPVWSVNEVIRRYPSALAVFKDFGIDTCCGGSLTPAEAARHKGTDPEALRAALARLAPPPAP